MERHVYIALVLLLVVYGQLIIKARSLSHAGAVELDRMGYLVRMFTDVGVLSGLAAALAASVFWMLAIERTDLGYAYPFVALSFVLVPVASAVLFGERISSVQFGGLVLIVAGVGLSAFAR